MNNCKRPQNESPVVPRTCLSPVDLPPQQRGTALSPRAPACGWRFAGAGSLDSFDGSVAPQESGELGVWGPFAWITVSQRSARKVVTVEPPEIAILATRRRTAMERERTIALVLRCLHRAGGTATTTTDLAHACGLPRHRVLEALLAATEMGLVTAGKKAKGRALIRTWRIPDKWASLRRALAPRREITGAAEDRLIPYCQAVPGSKWPAGHVGWCTETHSPNQPARRAKRWPKKTADPAVKIVAAASTALSISLIGHRSTRSPQAVRGGVGKSSRAPVSARLVQLRRLTGLIWPASTPAGGPVRQGR